MSHDTSCQGEGKWCISFHFEQQELCSSAKRLKHNLCDETLPLHEVNNKKKIKEVNIIFHCAALTHV